MTKFHSKTTKFFSVFLLYFFALLLSGNPLAAAGGQEEILSYLKSQIKDQAIIPPEEALPEIRKYMTEKAPNQQSPFICFGDFNGDGREDAAALLKKKKEKSKEDRLSLTVIEGSKDSGFKTVLLEEHSANYTIPDKKMFVFIMCPGPGMVWEFDGGEHKAEFDTIEYIYFEKGAKTYLFKEDKYKSIITGD